MNRLTLALSLTAFAAEFNQPVSCFVTPPTSTSFKPIHNKQIIPTTPSKQAPPIVFRNEQVQFNTKLNASPLLSPEASSDLLVYFLQTVISVGVPALATVAVIGFAALSFGRSNSRDRSKFSDYMEERNLAQELYTDLYGNSNSDKPSLPFSLPRGGPRQRSLPRNSGVPSQQYIKIKHLNTQLDSYIYSVTAATQSKASAASALRSKNFDRAVDKVFLGKELTDRQKMDLEYVEKEFLSEGSEMLEELEQIQRKSVENTLDKWINKLAKDDEEVGYEEKEDDVVDAEIVSTTNSTTNATVANESKKEKKNFLKGMMNSEKRELNKKIDEVNELNGKIMKLELKFMKDIMSVLGVERANMVKTLWVGNVVDGTGIGGSLLRGIKERPLSTLLSSDTSHKKNLFVTNFPGDVSASQVSELREEVTAILRSASKGDEALVVLQSGGGTVTGYGLAAAQLRRFKANGIKLTICVEQVAASGGYMMCCVADKVVASPFAVLGSIGVISDIPNGYERLKREGIEFQTITAGKYKRTITPTKKPTSEDLKKSKEDIEDILTLFKGFVKENRPALDIDAVATGETWFGQDALDRNLCDEIRTKDDVLLEYVDAGFEVFDVAYEPPLEPRASLLSIGAQSDGNKRQGKGLIKWLVRSFVNEIKGELLSEELSLDSNLFRKASSSDRIMLKDEGNAADRIRFES